MAETVTQSRLRVLNTDAIARAEVRTDPYRHIVCEGVLTPEAAARHPDRNKIFSCLGGVVPPQIAIGREFPLRLGDTIVLSTDGFWAQIQPAIMGTMLRKQTIIELFPGLLTEAHRRAAGESDNLSVVAMTWEAQDDPNAADTTQLEMEQFATATNTEALDAVKPADDVTEEDIERAIAEIQDAIKKVPR